MDYAQREAYEAKQKSMGYRLEMVPVSKIILTTIRGYKNLARSDESIPPELLKNQFGEYTLDNGMHRLYLAAQRIEGDPREATIQAWVKDVKAGRHVKGFFVWQIVHKPFRKLTRSEKLKSLLKRKKLRKNFFTYLSKDSRKLLSWKGRRLLRKIEFALQDLYLAEGNRLYDWEVIAHIEDFALSHGTEEKTKKNQLRRLREYEDVLHALVGKGVRKGKKTNSLIEEFAAVLAKDLQGKLPKEARDQLIKLQNDLIKGQRKDLGLQEVLEHQLITIRSGKIPNPTKIRQVISTEKKFYKKARYTLG